MFLSKEELAALTGKERPKAQARALTRMGIPHRTRPDGSPVVMRTHVEIVDAPPASWLARPQSMPELQP